MTQAEAPVREIYRAVSRGDIAAALAFIDRQIEVRQADVLPFGGTWRGHDGFAAMGAAIYAAWPDFAATPERFLSDGDTVVVLTRVTASGAHGRPPLDQAMLERWRLANGRAVECQPFYFDAAAAAASAAPPASSTGR